MKITKDEWDTTTSKRTRVSIFQGQRKAGYSSTKTVIPYQVERLNVGGAMNLATGTFAPSRPMAFTPLVLLPN